MRADLNRVAEFYHGYINRVKEDDVMTAFANTTNAFLSLLDSIPKEKHEFAYAPGKWTIKDLLQHLIDAERVFSYRALRFSRKDPTPLPGFEEKSYATNANANKREWDDLVEEFKTMRKATELLFRTFDEEQLDAPGVASGGSTYVLGIGYIIVGHNLHHMNVLKERYLQ